MKNSVRCDCFGVAISYVHILLVCLLFVQAQHLEAKEFIDDRSNSNEEFVEYLATIALTNQLAIIHLSGEVDMSPAIRQYVGSVFVIWAYNCSAANPPLKREVVDSLLRAMVRYLKKTGKMELLRERCQSHNIDCLS